ncbi:sensor histidine kinase [Arthrobacter sp. GMC3]|uniref:sensor histidine kinase n=1 Tax=Arthrobacter sp. GMC3 TaxID=2058894 RepID=UPI000CE532F7|nr:histidine kinase [Arthrobacter sp. GMC3]
MEANSDPQDKAVRVRMRKPWRKLSIAGALKVGISPMPAWVSFAIALFVTVSAVDDFRLFFVTHQDGIFPWWGLVGTVSYWALWMALAFRPQLAAPALLVLLVTMYENEQPIGALVLIFAALPVAAYRVSTRALIAIVGTFLVWQIAWVLGVSTLSPAALWGYFFITFLLIAPGLAVKILRERSVQAAQAQLAAKETAARAALEQRTELARELHDVVTHGLTMIAVQANLGKLADDGPVKEESLNEIGAMARNSLDDLRRLLRTMRTEDLPLAGGPSGSAGVSPSPATIDLALSVADTQKRLNSLGVLTLVKTSGDLSRIPNGLRSTVLRILQESATNIAKHTGHSSECHISLEVLDDRLELTIRNRMTPGKPRLPVSGTGLVGLRERASRLGGTLEAGPEEGWWRIYAVLPFQGPRTLR